MTAPLSYFLSWRTYGTWLPGDARGYVTDGHNKFGTPYAPPHGERHAQAEESMGGPPFVLSADGRAIAERTMREHCAIKQWPLHAINVRTNHAHLVVNCGGFDPDMAISQFKSWATRNLRAAGLAGVNQDVWARRGSTRYLWTDEDIEEACWYVRFGQ